MIGHIVALQRTVRALWHERPVMSGTTKLIVSGFASVLLVGVACGVIALFAVLAKAGVPAPPLSYQKQAYTPHDPVLCPKETLVFTPTLDINGSNGIPVPVHVTRTLWNITKNHAERDKQGVVIRIDGGTTNFPGDGHYDTPVSLPVPDVADTGTLEWETNADIAGHTYTGHHVRFTVRAGCP